MHVKPRSYLTAGIAALGVGAIALSPIQPIPSQVAAVPQRVVSDLGVELAAAVDPIQAWVNTFESTFANIGILGEFYMQKPFPLLQTIAANTATYLEEATNGNAGVIPEQIWGNIVKFFEAPWSPGNQFPIEAPPAVPDPVQFATGEYISDAKTDTPAENSPKSLYQTLLGLVILTQSVEPECSQDGDCLFVKTAPILNFLNTPFSGQLVGALGPLISPVVSLVNSFTAIGEYFEAGDVQSALFELINIPANMTNAFFNGAGYLDLTSIVTQILPLPVDTIGVNLGGLLNAVPFDGKVGDPDSPPSKYTGGVGFDSVATAVDLGFKLSWDGLPNGPLGGAIGMGQYLADQLLVTPAPPPAAEPPAETAAATQAAPVDLAPAEAPAEESAPAVVDVPAEESAPAVAELVEEDPAPAVENTAEVEASVEAAVEAVAENEAAAEIEAAVEAVEASAAEPAAAATPAAEDSGPEAAAADSDKSDDDTDRSGSINRRGAS